MTEKQQSVLKGLKDVGTGRVAMFEGGLISLLAAAFRSLISVRDLQTYRWYDKVETVEVPENGLWTVHLDGRIVVSKRQKGYFSHPVGISLIRFQQCIFPMRRSRP